MGDQTKHLNGAAFEEELAALLYDEQARAQLRLGIAADSRFLMLDVDEVDEAACAIRRMVRERTHRGTGGLADWFPQTLTAWHFAHPEDLDLGDLSRKFCASSSCSAWREHGSGVSLEEALYRFWIDLGVGDPEIVEEEFLSAIVRALAISPGARFERPEALRAAPGGCYAVSRRGVLHASLDGRYVHGALTPLVRELLTGADRDDTARRHGIGLAQLAEVVDALGAKGLLFE